VKPTNIGLDNDVLLTTTSVDVPVASASCNYVSDSVGNGSNQAGTASLFHWQHCHHWAYWAWATNSVDVVEEGVGVALGVSAPKNRCTDQHNNK